MSIQSFTEKLLSDIEKIFENEANNLLNAARQRTGFEGNIAGRMDGISDCIKQVHETYKLFVTSEKEPEDDTKSLY